MTVSLSRTETNPKEIVRLFSLVSIFLILAFNSGPVELYRDLSVHKNIYSSDKDTILRTFQFSEYSQFSEHSQNVLPNMPMWTKLTQHRSRATPQIEGQ